MEVIKALLLFFGIINTLLLSSILWFVYDIHFQTKYERGKS